MPERFHASEEFGGHAWNIEPEKILDLAHEDHDGNAIGKTDDDADRDEADQHAHLGEPHEKEQDAGDDGCDHQVLETVDADDAEHDGDESAGRAADLHA